MTRILDRYVAREVLAATGLVLLALLLLYAFFDLVFQLPNLGKGSYRLLNIFLFVGLNLPGHVYELLPVAALIGTLYALSQLNSQSELTAMRASGMSLAAIAGSLVIIGLVLGLLNLLFGELIAPETDRIANRHRLQSMNSLVAQEFRSGLWVKDGRAFVNIKEMLPDNSLRNLTIYQFDGGNRLQSIANAQRGDYQSGNRWLLTDVHKTSFDRGEVALDRLKTMQWETVVRPDILSVLLVVPEQMSIWSLLTYIDHLRENKQATLRYEIAQWSKLLHPFAVLVLMLLALPFSVHHIRSAGLSTKIFTGIMLGLAFQLLNRLFMNLGVLNEWNAVVSASLPSLLFLSMAMAMLFRVERR